jgi:hypothetical protein
MTPEQMLRCIPCQNQAMRMQPEPGGALVTVPLRRAWWARAPLTWVFPISRERRIQLDSVGSAVLGLCDGRRTVEDVIDSVMQQHHLTFQEARVAVMQFIRLLTERGVVALKIRKPGK